MAVTYRDTMSQGVGDEFSQSLRETYEFFKNRERVSILGEGIKDILGDQELFNEYVEKLCEGADNSEREQLEQLLENAKTNVLLESSVAGVQPVASLTFPTIRKLWARTGLVKAVPTEVVKSNSFSVSFTRPFIKNDDGTKEYLPEAIKGDRTGLKPRKTLSTDPITLPADKEDLLAKVGCSVAAGDTIDIDFAIASAKTAKGEQKFNSSIVREGFSAKEDTNGRIYLEVEIKDDDGNVVDTDTIFGYVDNAKGTFTASSVKGVVTEITVRGYVASDSHNRATNISFDIVHRDFTIGTGEHFEASLPLEFLQDSMATYNIDGTTEVVDTMSNVIAQKLDLEIAAFLDRVYEGTDAKYTAEFDIRPSAGFNGSPKLWREELKTVIDWVATKIKTDNYSYQGYFVLIGHKLDMMLIPNVNWTFSSSTETNGGVEVEYSVGAISGANRYTLVTSDLLEQGSITLLFVPTTNKFMSVKYYPYTFNIVNNYLNTQTAAIPSIMATKRQTMEEFLPLIGKINILHNTASMLKDLPR